MKILAVIPARSGSKGLPNKNIKYLNGKPLVAHSIQQAIESKLINRVIVSTDSQEYADTAKEYGAETPFLRPDEYAQDDSIDLFVFQHTLNWLERNEKYVPDICVHLRPTYPVRNVKDIDKAIEIMIDDEDIDCVRTIAPAPFTPFKMWFMRQDKTLMPACTESWHFTEPWNAPRQQLPCAYIQTANIDVIRTNTITEKGSMTGDWIHGMVIEHKVDIDSELEFRLAEELLGE
jgi:CMP-N,N'-diacetyllegionaminic acid synthase